MSTLDVTFVVEVTYNFEFQKYDIIVWNKLGRHFYRVITVYELVNLKCTIEDFVDQYISELEKGEATV
jgi:hypothetical protein